MVNRIMCKIINLLGKVLIFNGQISNDNQPPSFLEFPNWASGASERYMDIHIDGMIYSTQHFILSHNLNFWLQIWIWSTKFVICTWNLNLF